MREKNGFTLLELMAVIVVLALLTLIIYPPIDSALIKSRNQSYETQISEIEEGAKNWAADHVTELPDEDNSIKVTIKTLEDGGYIAEDLIDPRYNKPLDKNKAVIITNVGNQYQYKFEDRFNEGDVPDAGEPTPTPTSTPPTETYPKSLRFSLTSNGILSVTNGGFSLASSTPSGSTAAMVSGKLESGKFEVGHRYQVRIEMHTGEFLTNMSGALALQIKNGQTYDCFEALSGSWTQSGNVYTFDFTVPNTAPLSSNIGGFALGTGGSYFQWNSSTAGSIMVATVSVSQLS